MAANDADDGTSLVREDLVTSQYSGASNLAFNQLVKEWMKAGRKIYHFAFGQSPFPIMETAVQALRDHAGDNAYLDVQGLPDLREAVCKFHTTWDNLTLSPDDVIVAPGSKELIFLLMTVFRGNVLILSPSWTTYRPQAILSGHTPIVVDASMGVEWKLTPKALEEAILSQRLQGPSLLILTNPCNPTGTAYSESELKELTVVFRKYNVIVLSDEIYARLNYAQDHISLAGVYPEGTVLSSGLSKWASAGGWRLGYHVFPRRLAALRNAVKSAASHSYSCAPAPVQRAAIQMLHDETGCQDYIRHTARVMSAVADFCYRELTSVGVRMVRPKGGYYMFPDFEVVREPLRMRGVNTCEEMCALMLDECSVAVMAGGPSYLRPLEELTTRLCYVNFDGSDALARSRTVDLSLALPPDFVQESCTPVYDGIMSLKAWVEKLLKN